MTYWAALATYAKGLANLTGLPVVVAVVAPMLMVWAPGEMAVHLATALMVVLACDLVAGATVALQQDRFSWRTLGMASVAKSTFYGLMLVVCHILATAIAAQAPSQRAHVLVSRDFAMQGLATLCILVEVRSVVRNAAKSGMRVARVLDKIFARWETQRIKELEHVLAGEGDK
jgi:hypothetical protein